MTCRLDTLKNERIMRSELLSAESSLQAIQIECRQFQKHLLFDQVTKVLSSNLSSIEQLLLEYEQASENMPQFDFDVYAPWYIR